MLSNKVREIMTTDVFAVEATLSIFEVMETMTAKDVGRILITKNGKAAGIFTEQEPGLAKNARGSSDDSPAANRE
jgi:predicted transcriptional regulator